MINCCAKSIVELLEMKSDFIQDLCANKFDALPDRLRSYKEPNTIKLCFKLIN